MLLISVYGYLQFRESHSYEGQLAKNAGIVYKINVDGLIKTMAADFSSNPGYYLKAEEKGGQQPDFSFPANIFIYSLNTMAPSTIFTQIGLKDTVGLKRYLNRVLKISTFLKEGERNIGVSADHKTTVVYEGQTLAIAYSFKREGVMEELTDILDRKNRMEDHAPLMTAVRKAKGHFSWTTLQYGGEVNFKDGRAEIDGLFPTEGLNIPDQPSCRVKFADDAFLKIWVNAGLQGILLPKELPLKDVYLESDTLLKAYQGFAAVEMGPAITQIDSLIGYEYNDDFEKVATVQLKKVRVPHLKLSCSANTTELMHYLKGKQVLTETDHINKELFPLYQVFSIADQGFWQLSTLKNDQIKQVSVGSKDFFAADVDLNAVKVQQQFPLINSLLVPFSHLTITASKLADQKARIRGELGFQEKNINAFIQLIK